ncbi:hypothetical protein CEXT_709951 [Caerostris extrusa]|uniref:Uncharacterized protein n=1 Tax=Caerostris extrusa TaxID=172846 RepID=A0AAV4XPZ1_CAEEX|nr:hypothetical protein CEXT_709951 [Caerostris extrusa]
MLPHRAGACEGNEYEESLEGVEDGEQVPQPEDLQKKRQHGCHPGDAHDDGQPEVGVEVLLEVSHSAAVQVLHAVRKDVVSSEDKEQDIQTDQREHGTGKEGKQRMFGTEPASALFKHRLVGLVCPFDIVCNQACSCEDERGSPADAAVQDVLFDLESLGGPSQTFRRIANGPKDVEGHEGHPQEGGQEEELRQGGQGDAGGDVLCNAIALRNDQDQVADEERQAQRRQIKTRKIVKIRNQSEDNQVNHKECKRHAGPSCGDVTQNSGCCGSR